MSSISIQQQLLIGLDFNESNPAQIDDSEAALQSPLAELNRIKRFADPLEQLFELTSGVKGRVQAVLRLHAACQLGAQSNAGGVSGHIELKWTIMLCVFFPASTNI